MWAYAALAGFQVWNGISQGNLIRANADIQREVGEMNSKFAELDAYEAEKYGYTEANRYQSTIDSTIEAQRMEYASKNVDVNFGTAAEVQKETRLTGYLNQLDIINQAHEKAIGLKRQAINYRLGAQAQQSQAAINESAARTSGLIQAGGTLATGYMRT